MSCQFGCKKNEMNLKLYLLRHFEFKSIVRGFKQALNIGSWYQKNESLISLPENI